MLLFFFFDMLLPVLYMLNVSQLCFLITYRKIMKCSGYMFAATTNQQLVGSRNRMMDETDQIIQRSKKVG